MARQRIYKFSPIFSPLHPDFQKLSLGKIEFSLNKFPIPASLHPLPTSTQEVKHIRPYLFHHNHLIYNAVKDVNDGNKKLALHVYARSEDID